MTHLLHHLLTRAASRDPSHEAVRCTGRSLTYGELEAASNGLARALIAGGVRPGDRVGIHMPKSVEMVAAVYGTLKAGAAYVPLDPKAPVARLAMVAGDCTIAALITTTARAQKLIPAIEGHSHMPGLAVLADPESEAAGAATADLPCPSLSYQAATADPSATDPAVPVIDQDLAYILYTSGSTGVPKGVMLTHRNALTFVEWCASTLDVGPEDRLSNHAPLHFDLSVLDLFLSAFSGATVVLVPDDEAYFATELAELIERERLTVWYSVPSALMLLGRARGNDRGAFPTLRTVVFAGEVYPTARLRELRRLVPTAVLWNLYGPTETNVCTYYRVDDLPEDDRTIPIGRACENTQVFAVKEDGTLAGNGEDGELYVRGSTVMKGYWNAPDRTSEVLVPNPIDPTLPDLVFRTGDLVRIRPDGNYEFLGRRDHQIKSRGYRVELGEVESVLNAHPSVAEAVALAVPHPEWGSAIAVYVVPKDGLQVTVAQAKKHVAARLPRYMIPHTVRIVSDLPRTSTGKVDRRGLADRLSERSVDR